MKKIIDIKESTMQEKILLTLTIIILLAVGTSVLRHLLLKSNNIDYNNESITSLYDNAITVSERDIYWILNNIIDAYIKSYYLELDSISEYDRSQIIYSRGDYYEVLSNDYKKFLNKNKYMQLSENMLKKFIINESFLKEDNYIYEVRYLDSNKYRENMYICKLNTINKDVESYIGIQLKPNKNLYNIFYLE